MRTTRGFIIASALIIAVLSLVALPGPSLCFATRNALGCLTAPGWNYRFLIAFALVLVAGWLGASTLPRWRTIDPTERRWQEQSALVVIVSIALFFGVSEMTTGLDRIESRTLDLTNQVYASGTEIRDALRGLRP